MICPHCRTDFAARRTDQVYGEVSVIVRFAPGDADKAVQFCPGRVVEVVA